MFFISQTVNYKSAVFEVIFCAGITHILEGTFGKTAVCNEIQCNIKMVSEYHLEQGGKMATCGRRERLSLK